MFLALYFLGHNRSICYWMNIRDDVGNYISSCSDLNLQIFVLVTVKSFFPTQLDDCRTKLLPSNHHQAFLLCLTVSTVVQICSKTTKLN